MIRIEIDFSKARSREDIHEILKFSLNLPNYYGNNLDALYDCLTTVFFHRRTEFVLKGLDSLPEDLQKYGCQVKNVFIRAAAESIRVSDSTFMIVSDK